MTFKVEVHSSERDESSTAAAVDWSFSQQGFGVNITNGWITNSQHKANVQEMVGVRTGRVKNKDSSKLVEGPTHPATWDKISRCDIDSK